MTSIPIWNTGYEFKRNPEGIWIKAKLCLACIWSGITIICTLFKAVPVFNLLESVNIDEYTICKLQQHLKKNFFLWFEKQENIFPTFETNV